jgi:hypothetical protein
VARMEGLVLGTFSLWVLVVCGVVLVLASGLCCGFSEIGGLSVLFSLMQNWA